MSTADAICRMREIPGVQVIPPVSDLSDPTNPRHGVLVACHCRNEAQIYKIRPTLDEAANAVERALLAFLAE